MSGTTSQSGQQAPSFNIMPDLSNIPGWGVQGAISANSPGGIAANVLGQTEGNDVNGNPVTNTPYINPNYTTGLDLSSLPGLDTLAERVAFNDPNAQFIQDTFAPNSGPGQNVYSWLAQGGPNEPYTTTGSDTALYPDPGNPYYIPGGQPGSVDLTQAGAERAAADFNAGQGQNTGPPSWLLSLPVVLASAGAGLYGALAADAGTAAADAGTAAADIGTSDLGAITAGAGDIGGVSSGLTSAGVLGTSDLGAITAGAGDIGAAPADALPTIAGGDVAAGFGGAGTGLGTGADVLGTSDLGAITAGAGDVGTAPADALPTAGGLVYPDFVSSGAGGLVSTAPTGIDPTVFSDASGGLGAAPPSDITLAASSSDSATAPGGFWSDLTSGNFSNLGDDVSNWFSSSPPVTSLSNAASAQEAADEANPVLQGLAGNPAAAPIGTSGATGGGSWLDTLGSKLVSGLSDPFRLLGLGASGIGLAKNLLTANKANPIPGMSNVQNTANQLTQQGATLQNYLTSGTLPAGVQASLDQATHSAIEAVKSNFASRGIAPGSTMEQQQIAAIQQNAAAQGGQLALNLLNSGVQMSDLGAQLYSSLVQTNVALNSQTEQAIANLASALAGGNHITLQASPTAA